MVFLLPLSPLALPQPRAGPRKGGTHDLVKTVAASSEGRQEAEPCAAGYTRVCQGGAQHALVDPRSPSFPCPPRTDPAHTPCLRDAGSLCDATAPNQKVPLLRLHFYAFLNSHHFLIFITMRHFHFYFPEWSY